MMRKYIQLVVCGLIAAIGLTTGSGLAAAESAATQGTERIALTPDMTRHINAGLESVGRAPLPEGAATLVVSENVGPATVLDQSGIPLARPNDQKQQPIQIRGVVDEIKGVVGACLGISANATSVWAGIVEQLTSWQKAVKFVVRRIGVVAAVSCMGGIVWRYI